MSALEWMLATRWLLRAKPRSWLWHLLTLALIAQAAAVHLASFVILHKKASLLVLHPELRAFLMWARPASLIAIAFWGFLAELVRRLSVFSAISTFGLFLATGAMVIVLSVMGGFELDLKHKIIGANAHILVTSPDKPFTDYRALRERIARVPDVVAVSPYLSSEVMITSQSNLAGVVIRGIDPDTIGATTDLKRDMEQGSLDFLNHPEKLDVPEPQPLAPPTGFEEKATPSKDERKEKSEKAPADSEIARTAKGEDKEHKAIKPPEEKSGVTFVPVDSHGKPLELPAAEHHKVRPTVVIGRELAKNLRVYLADDVNLVSPMGDIGPTGPMPRSRPFRVAGIFYTGMYEYDSKNVYTSIPAAQKFLGTDDEITGFEIRVRDADETEEPVAAIQKIVGSGYQVQDWKELNKQLFSALKVEQIVMFILLCFVILVACFSIVANGIMLVREKGRGIAMLKSMGIPNGAVLRSFFYMGVGIGGLGTVVGVTTGVLASLALGFFGVEFNSDVFYIAKLPIVIDPLAVAAIAVAAIGMALVAILYPAWAAARLRPVEGLRWDNS